MRVTSIDPAERYKQIHDLRIREEEKYVRKQEENRTVEQRRINERIERARRLHLDVGQNVDLIA